MKKSYLFILTILYSKLIFSQCTQLVLQPDATTGEDAYMVSITNVNLGNEPSLIAEAWTSGGNPVEATALLKFDLTSVPAGATITSAKLSLYADSTSVYGYAGQPTYGNDNASYLQMITSAWAENNVIWNNKPTTTATGQILLPQSASTDQDYLNIDIAAFAQQWADNPAQNYGMMLDMITSVPYNCLIFCSSDHPIAAKRPKLEICYSTPNGLDENEKYGARLSVFPNPATNQLNINLGGLQAEQVSIYNVDGKLVSTVKQPANNSLDISGFANGVYIAEINLGGAVQRVRWVKM